MYFHPPTIYLYLVCTLDDGHIWRSKAWLIDGQNVVVKTWANHDFGLVLKLATLSNLACQICGKYFFSWLSTIFACQIFGTDKFCHKPRRPLIKSLFVASLNQGDPLQSPWFRDQTDRSFSKYVCYFLYTGSWGYLSPSRLY